MGKDLRIVYMGTPDFAVESLKILVENSYNIVGVITAPDKPAGRGQKIMQSAVKKYADANSLKTLQPTNLKSEEFLAELKSLNMFKSLPFGSDTLLKRYCFVLIPDKLSWAFKLMVHVLPT